MRLLAPALLVLVVGLTACAGLETVPEQVDPAHQSRLRSLYDNSAWRVAGRFAIQKGGEGWNGRLEWQRQGESWQLALIPPLIGNEVRWYGDPAGVVLHNADGTRDRAPSAATLLRRRLGFEVPVTDLGYWMVGLARPGRASNLQLDARGLPLTLEQDGWAVRYKRYQQVDDVYLPNKLAVEGHGLKLRLVLDDWRLTPLVPPPAAGPDRAG